MNNGSPTKEGALQPGAVTSEPSEPMEAAEAVTESSNPVLESSPRRALPRSEHGPPRPLIMIGDVVGGKYRVEAELGQGGMGTVFRATHLVSEKAVAIKCTLRSHLDLSTQRRFVREARAAARVDHPNVVDVYDIGQDRDLVYLVMELLRGESLRTRLCRGGLEVAEAIQLLLPAMRGVLAVHQAGVIHRDLKPDNIFLCEGPQGARREAKVLDFGVSVVAAKEPNDPTLTREGTVLGTPAYMSPEQLYDSRDVDVRTDVYAFGVILYEALTGVLPQLAHDYNGLVLAIANTPPVDPVKLRPEIPRGLGRVMLKALSKQRERRYADIASLMAALEPFAGLGGCESGALYSLPRRTIALRGRLWAWVSAGLVTGLVVAWWHFGVGQVANELEARPRGNGQRRMPSVSPSLDARPPSLAGAQEEPSATKAESGPTPFVSPPENASELAPDAATGLAEKQRSRRASRSNSRRVEPKHREPAQEPTKARSGSISLEEL